MAHELAHYYFGNLLKSDVEFAQVINEGFAEYLALILTKELEGTKSYEALISTKIKALKYLKNYKPLAQATTEKDFGNREYYLYYYTPIILLAVEKELGQENMWQWLKLMVTTASLHTDYNFILNTLKKAVPDKMLQEKIISNYFTSLNALKTAETKIGF